jgi:hypothetical protein
VPVGRVAPEHRDGSAPDGRRLRRSIGRLQGQELGRFRGTRCVAVGPPAARARRRDRFCLRGRPNLVNARLLVAGLTVSCCVVAKCMRRSWSVASGVACTQVLRAARPVGSSWAGEPPPCGGGATSPVVRERVRRSRTHLRLSRKRAAHGRSEPARCSYACTTLRRKSLEEGRRASSSARGL